MNSWNPSQYLQFGHERTRPAVDLVSAIDVESPASIIDLGCGPGNSTAAPRKPNRLARERRMIRVMIQLYCRDHHHCTGDPCADCGQLLAYAMERIDKCPFDDVKPTCARCPVHCYKPAKREQIRQVMWYAGPRMMRAHPVLTLRHWIDGMTEPPPSKAGLKGRRC